MKAHVMDGKGGEVRKGYRWRGKKEGNAFLLCWSSQERWRCQYWQKCLFHLSADYRAQSN